MHAPSALGFGHWPHAQRTSGAMSTAMVLTHTAAALRASPQRSPADSGLELWVIRRARLTTPGAGARAMYVTSASIASAKRAFLILPTLRSVPACRRLELGNAVRRTRLLRGARHVGGAPAAPGVPADLACEAVQPQGGVCVTPCAARAQVARRRSPGMRLHGARPRSSYQHSKHADAAGDAVSRSKHASPSSRTARHVPSSHAIVAAAISRQHPVDQRSLSDTRAACCPRSRTTPRTCAQRRQHAPLKRAHARTPSRRKRPAAAALVENAWTAPGGARAAGWLPARPPACRR